MSTEAATEEGKVEEVKTETPAGEIAPEKTEEQKKAEARHYSQEEVDKILAKVRKNERYRTRKEVEAFYQGRESATKPGEPKKEAPKEDKEPVRGDFESYEAFIEARADYRARKAVSEERAKGEQETKERTAQESRQKTAAEFQRKVREKVANLDELLEEVGDAPMYEGVQDAIMESPLGPEIFHELLQNPKEFDRLASLTQAAAIREIGKLEARLEAKAPKAETKETKPASKAPAPVAPPGGSAAASSDMPSDSDSTDEWMRKERARLAKLRK